MTHKNISHPAEPMRIGSLVRWNEYPDRLYYVIDMPVSFCGSQCAKLKTIDSKHISIVPIDDLTLDDVDYDEQ